MFTAENSLYLVIGAVDAARQFVATRMNPFGCGYATGGAAKVFPGEKIELHDHDVMDSNSGKVLHGTPEQPIARYMSMSLGLPFIREPYSQELHGEKIEWVNVGDPVPVAPEFIHKHGTKSSSIGPWEV